MKILVIGTGQLGTAIKNNYQYNNPQNDEYFFLGHNELDITKEESLKNAFDKIKPNVVINCAAYTNVEKAQEETDKAYQVNSTGVYNLRTICKKYKAYLIHISTDYVFDGEKGTPYNENDFASPLNNYGMTKLSGEVMLSENKNALIIRTSWLYSIYGENFLTKMVKMMKNGEKISVVCDQVGCPTNAEFLADDIIKIISERTYKDKSGLYHYSGNGCCSWFDFAKMIEFFLIQEEIIKSGQCNVVPCFTKDTPSKVKRPKYSVLDNTKFNKDFGDKTYLENHWCKDVYLAILKM